MDSAIWSVADLNSHIKALLDSDRALAALSVRGEISNFKRYPSGHRYFTLKDEQGVLRCVMFKSSAETLKFTPEDGMTVIARGRVAVFARDGQYQLYCSELIPDGVGALYLAFEQLKKRLGEEGLFEPNHKKPLPVYPSRIALVTSPAGAAVRDMLRVLKSRWPLAEVVIVPVRVQGEEAPGELCAGIRYVDRHKLADLIITGRGGGSIEDLWAFNSEALARVIYDCETPVISAVGHEPDFTICDFVADLRAATLSNAAELAVPDREHIKKQLSLKSAQMRQSMTQKLKVSRQRLEGYATRKALTDPKYYIQEKRVLLDYLHTRGIAAAEKKLAESKNRFAALAAAAQALSPLRVIARGYLMATDDTGGVIKSVRQTGQGRYIALRLKDGALDCTVDAVREDTHAEG